MQLVRHYLESISNVGIYPLIALFIFLVFFTLIVIHTLSMKKGFEKEAGRLPLDDSKTENLNKNN